MPKRAEGKENVITCETKDNDGRLAQATRR